MIGYWHLVWWVLPIMFLICIALCMIGMFRSWRRGVFMWGCCPGMNFQRDSKSDGEGGGKDG